MDHLVFLRSAFTVCTFLSASPLDCGCFGLLILYTNPYSFENLANSLEEYCGPLSDSKMNFIRLITGADFSEFIFAILKR